MGLAVTPKRGRVPSPLPVQACVGPCRAGVQCTGFRSAGPTSETNARGVSSRGCESAGYAVDQPCKQRCPYHEKTSPPLPQRIVALDGV